MKALVTGATGFIGSHLVEELLSRGFHVRALVRPQWKSFLPYWLKEDVQIVWGDITDASCIKNAVRGVDVVFHLAALLGRWQSEYPEAEYYRVNVTGTKLLIDQCIKEGINHFIYLSTAGVMGRLKTAPADENHQCRPMFPYEKSKYYAELKLKDVITKKRFPATIIRPAHVYGPRDKNTFKLFKLIKFLKVFPLIDGGHNIFQPIYIEDLVKALVLCVEKSDMSIGKTYLVAGKERLTFRDFIILSAKILDVPLVTFSVPRRLIELMAKVNENLKNVFNFEPLLTLSRVEFFSRNQSYRTEKIEKEVGFRPRVNITAGLQRTISFFKRNAML